MKKDEASKLLKRFLSAQQEGKEPYFDADEIDRLLDSLEEADDWTYYGDIIRLGMKLHPGYQELKVRECRLYIVQQKYQKALEMLDSLSDVPSQDMDMVRLECYCNLEKYKKVIQYIQSLTDNQCDHLETLFEYIAGVLNDLDMNEEARDFINRGLKLYPDNLILKDELCYLLEAKGEFAEAIRLCNELIDKDPFSYDTWFMLGRLYSMTGEFEKAIEAFDYALACDESDLELKILKSYCLFMNEDYEKAIEAYRELGTDEESAERIKPLIAECYIKLERFEDCYQILKEIIHNPGEDPDPTSYINYIRCCLETGRQEEGLQALHTAVQLYPGDVRILSILALNYIENGKEEQALKVTNQIFDQIELEQQDGAIEKKDFFHNSLNFCFNGDLTRALKYYKKVFDFKPDMPFMHIQRAMAYFNIGDMELFDKYYRKASSSELSEYIRLTSLDCKDRFNRVRHIQPEDLTFEYLYNKDNNN